MWEQEKSLHSNNIHISGWKLALACLAVSVIFIVFGIVFAGLLIVLLPAMLLTGFAFWLLSQKGLRKADKKTKVIEGEYTVIDK